jgi:hypothetical protein
MDGGAARLFMKKNTCGKGLATEVVPERPSSRL